MGKGRFVLLGALLALGQALGEAVANARSPRGQPPHHACPQPGGAPVPCPECRARRPVLRVIQGGRRG